MPRTKLLVCLLSFTLGAPTAIDGDGTCANGGDGEHVTPTPDISALFQSKTSQVLAARVTPKGDPNMASIRPRMQKLMDMNTTLNAIIAMGKAGMTPVFKAIIEDLVRVVEDDLRGKIQDDHAFAQSKLDERIAELTNTTERAVDDKTLADMFDVSLDQCITEEQRLLQVYETCKADEAGLETEKPSADYCGHPDFHIAYRDPPQLPYTLTVDFSQGLFNVQQKLEDYLAPLKQWIDAMKAKAAIDQVNWDTADQTCKAKTKELEDKTTECGERLEAWRSQHEKCQHAQNAQEKSLCEFGHAYQSKCTAKTVFDTLKTDITGSGTSYSELDRKLEWRQTARLLCVLIEMKSTTELTTGAVEACTKSDDKAAEEFEKDVGSIDVKQATYDLLTSEATFTCREAAVKVGHVVLWTVPKNTAGDVPKSTEYTMAAGYTYAIESDPSNAPFDFCLEKIKHPTAPTCGSAFDCAAGSGSPKPAATRCYGWHGHCTSADCCVDMFEPAPAPVGLASEQLEASLTGKNERQGWRRWW